VESGQFDVAANLMHAKHNPFGETASDEIGTGPGVANCADGFADHSAHQFGGTGTGVATRNETVADCGSNQLYEDVVDTLHIHGSVEHAGVDDLAGQVDGIGMSTHALRCCAALGASRDTTSALLFGRPFHRHIPVMSRRRMRPARDKHGRDGRADKSLRAKACSQCRAQVRRALARRHSWEELSRPLKNSANRDEEGKVVTVAHAQWRTRQDRTGIA
jgi:hypothetical protein